MIQFFLLLAFFFSAHMNVAHAADASVPLLLQYQGLLTDGGGNPLASGAVSLEFRITDAAHQPLYREIQAVNVNNGVVSTLIGNGTDPRTGGVTTGLRPEMLSPIIPHYLEVWRDGALADDPMEIVSVPYALWSDTATHVAPGSIDATALAAGAIEMSHLAPDFVDTLAAKLVETNALQSAFASTNGANAVGVNSTFTYSGAQNVQGVLQDLDRAIKAREEKNVSRGGDTMQGPLAIAAGGLSVTGDISVSGKVDGVEVSTLDTSVATHTKSTSAHGSDGAVVGSNTLTDQIATRVNKNGDTMNGALQIATGGLGVKGGFVADSATVNGAVTANAGMNVVGDISVSGKVDGVDVSALDGSVAKHTESTSAHGSDGNVVGSNTLTKQIDTRVNKNGDTMQGALQIATGGLGVKGGFVADSATVNGTVTANAGVNVVGDISVRGKVDGVEVSTLDTSVATHTKSTSAHGSDGDVVGSNTLTKQIDTRVNKNGDTMQGALSITNGGLGVKGGFVADRATLSDVVNANAGVNVVGDISVSGKVDGVDVSNLDVQMKAINGTSDTPGLIQNLQTTKLARDGDTMTGPLTLQAGLHGINGLLQIYDNVEMNGKQITGLADPVQPQDAVNKTYIDAAVATATAGPKIVAWGTVDCSGRNFVDEPCDLKGSFGVKSVFSPAGVGWKIVFTDKLSSANYALNVTPVNLPNSNPLQKLTTGTPLVYQIKDDSFFVNFTPTAQFEQFSFTVVQ